MPPYADRCCAASGLKPLSMGQAAVPTKSRRAKPLRGLGGWGTQDKANGADSTPIMTQPQSSADKARTPIERVRASRGTGSIALVLLLAFVLVAAAGAVLIARAKAEPYVIALVAVLATLGVFLLFALAAGILRVSGLAARRPLLAAVVDHASDGTLVTDADGRVVYANAAYLELIEASGPRDVRPVERVFMGDAAVSEAAYRLLRAAREGRRSQEEVPVSARKGESGRWLRIRVRPLGDGKRESRMTVWSLADVTRDLERHENVFQELQHAIDYLDHAPAGFFSAEANGNIVYLNATLANWLDYDLTQVGTGGLKLDQIVAGEGAAPLTTLAAGARGRETGDSGIRPQTAPRPPPPAPLLPQNALRPPPAPPRAPPPRLH